MLSCGVTMLYSNFMPPAKLSGRLASKCAASTHCFSIDQPFPIRMTKIVEEVAKKPIPAHQRHLVFEVCVTDPEADDEDADPEVYVLHPEGVPSFINVAGPLHPVQAAARVELVPSLCIRHNKA